jgi:hypothetical protein
LGERRSDQVSAEVDLADLRRVALDFMRELDGLHDRRTRVERLSAALLAGEGSLTLDDAGRRTLMSPRVMAASVTAAYGAARSEFEPACSDARQCDRSG